LIAVRWFFLEVLVVKRNSLGILLVGLLFLLAPFVLAQNAPSSTGADATVYVTKAGKKYHTKDCRMMKGAGTAMKLSDAVKQGYTPCKVCKPPALNSSSSQSAKPATKKS
jgi:hypothetical protein